MQFIKTASVRINARKGVCREVAEKLYDKYLYRKAFAYNNESPEQTAFERGYAKGYCDGKETVSKELHRILQETIKSKKNSNTMELL